MPSIATLETASNALDTTAKFVRLIGNEGVTMEQFRLPIDDQAARRNTAAFFKNGCQLIIKGPSALLIDRAKLPTPAQFIGKDWSIWRGPKEGNGLDGELDEDLRSVVLTEIDFSQVQFVHCLQESEDRITGEVKLERMKAMPNIRYDFGVGVALLQEKGQATLCWLYDTYGITWFELATVLRNPYGSRCFLYLRRYVGGSWYWNFSWLESVRSRDSVSPVSAS